MKINNNETAIIGNWKFNGLNVIKDEQSQRIEKLIDDYLILISNDASGWDTLYQDPVDHRYWELIYPQSEIHGGGPPSLLFVSDIRAKEKYSIKS